MPRLITLFEHQHTRNCPWDERDLLFLERLRALTGADVLRPVIRAGQRELQATQHVGVFRLGPRIVQVLPKAHRTESSEDESARQATRNLLAMLDYAWDVPVRETVLTPLLRGAPDWFEVLTRIFADHLASEWQRGAWRGYQSRDEELCVLRGRWRIAEQLRRPGRDHLFAVHHDEFTADNPLNRVFRYVVERLWRVTRQTDNRCLLGDLRQWLDEVTLLPFVGPEEASPSLLTRLTRRYAPLLNLARLFLSRSSVQPAAGDNENFAFVFDMNQLFESFLTGFLRRHFAEAVPRELQDCDLRSQAQGVSLHLAERAGIGPVFRLEPDIAFVRRTTFPCLVDAKYKRLEPGARDLGVAREDFYQMVAYAQRYESLRVVLLYPQIADAPRVRARFALQNANIEVATIDLQQDLVGQSGRLKLMAELQHVLGGHDGERGGIPEGLGGVRPLRTE
jgi:5-methylcytosine-specific restriction enzyme subunit McrC